MKPRVAVHKFSSCDGCQLAFLNMGEDLITLSRLVDLVHFAEAGMVNEDAPVDIAFVEGSVSTPHEVERIRRVREHSRFVVTLGACATAGGIQALRNMADTGRWMAGVYARPEVIAVLPQSTPVRDHIRVDLELWGCPVNSRQVVEAVRSLLSGATPVDHRDKICLECKRRNHVCVLVAKGEPCMGPVTRTGCGALCPSVGRDCFACYGPAENANTGALGRRFAGLGLVQEEVAQRFLFVNNAAEPFHGEGRRWQGGGQ
ncbi:MAG: sulfhydrogenase subunit delta [Thiohalomonadaceae bacterium]